MADPSGFLRHRRHTPAKRPVPDRLGDWREVYEPFDTGLLREQAARCMDCGVPFCQSDIAGCPLANRIPDWNDLVRTDQWELASEQLHATNNFPEMTGRLCPAPCEAACVLGINPDHTSGAVTIKQIELEIVDRAFAEGWVTPRPPARRLGTRVAVVGSGPAGLAAAQQLTRAGHDVTLYERDDALGGLCRYGIPDFKMEKRHLDRRIEQMTAEGTTFVTSCDVGTDLGAEQLRRAYDAVVLAVGAQASRDIPDLPGRDLTGVHLAMSHLVPANRMVAGLADTTPIDARGRHVVIIGGGDTAADCLGVSHRQGAASVTQLDLYPQPPDTRDPDRTPWPTWPWLLRSYPAHEEGGDRVFAVSVEEFVDGGRGHVGEVRLSDVQVRKEPDGRRIITPVPGSRRGIPTDLVLLAIGFDGVERMPLLGQLGVELTSRGTIRCGPDWQTTAPGVFACGDAKRGASLIVWAIAEGRSVAASVDAHLTGSSNLHAPVHPTALPLAL